jgi:hypothetical protein
MWGGQGPSRTVEPRGKKKQMCVRYVNVKWRISLLQVDQLNLYGDMLEMDQLTVLKLGLLIILQN